MAHRSIANKNHKLNNKTFNVAFRADASLKMGFGHIFRCLTLAKALRARGAECLFICREHEGNLLDFIR